MTKVEVDYRTISHVNYEDPDINVAIPVFSIHGNHDDPTGDGHLCALDILQVSGLVNYIGRIPANDDITVNPLLLQKGSTLLALYGLSNVRDERMFNTFREGKVRFRRPAERMDDWFNLLAVHQNQYVLSVSYFLWIWGVQMVTDSQCRETWDGVFAREFHSEFLRYGHLGT